MIYYKNTDVHDYYEEWLSFIKFNMECIYDACQYAKVRKIASKLKNRKS